MKRAAILAAALLLAWTAAAHADFYDGLRAYDAGDHAAAASEWSTAADQGDVNAQYRLGRLYEEGLGVPQNFVEAHRWYNLAASRGQAEAREAREAIAERMAPVQLAEAQQLAADWQPAAEPAEAEAAAVEEEEAGPTGLEALLSAAATGDAGRVEALLAEGVDPNAATPDGWTALMVAAAEGQREVVEILLQAGAEVNVQSADQATPLLVAIFGGHGDVAEALLAAGADPAVTAPDGQSALALAEARGLQAVVARLREAAPATPEALFEAAEAGELERVQAMLGRGVEVDAADEDGWTALMFAIAGGHTEVAEALLEAGAEVNVTAGAGGISGWTPLMFAAVTGDEELVQALLNAGAAPGAENAQGLTARAVAEQKGHEQIVRLLPPPGPVVDEQVREAQRLLAALGYDPGPADGIIGPRTRSAVREFQRLEGLAETGEVSAALLAELKDGRFKTAPQAREQTVSDRQPGETFNDCNDEGWCPEMVVVPPGSFMMGSPEGEAGRSDSEGPRRRVKIAEPFAIGVYEVTFDEWDACVADGGCAGHRPRDFDWGRGRRPVVDVSWHQAQAYVDWLSNRTGQEYRLPSEAEWEYAARAGTTTPFHFGPTISTDQANYFDIDTYVSGEKGVNREEQTMPVGSFPPNDFGLHDVHGNVSEWVEDCWNASYAEAGRPDDGTAWKTGDCSRRVLRGGFWEIAPPGIRSASRLWLSADHLSDSVNDLVGFRVARTFR